MLSEAQTFFENNKISNIIFNYIFGLNLQSPLNLKCKYKYLMKNNIWGVIVFQICVLPINLCATHKSVCYP